MKYKIVKQLFHNKKNNNSYLIFHILLRRCKQCVVQILSSQKSRHCIQRHYIEKNK